MKPIDTLPCITRTANGGQLEPAQVDVSSPATPHCGHGIPLERVQPVPGILDRPPSR
jgi:hypothetical protein